MLTTRRIPNRSLSHWDLARMNQWVYAILATDNRTVLILIIILFSWFLVRFPAAAFQVATNPDSSYAINPSMQTFFSAQKSEKIFAKSKQQGHEVIGQATLESMRGRVSRST